MGVSSLRYPGGEEANTYMWAPPPYTAQTKPKPVLTTTKGFPGGDFLFYSRWSGAFQYSVMDFDQVMGVAAALNATQSYVVLNHDSINVGGNLGDPAWGYNDLKAAAVAWASYIARKAYPVRAVLPRGIVAVHTLSWGLTDATQSQVRHFELSNESWKTNQAAQYAWALLDWAPALKQAYPAALIGANGPVGRKEVGDKDHGIAWWHQVLVFLPRNLQILPCNSL